MTNLRSILAGLNASAMAPFFLWITCISVFSACASARPQSSHSASASLDFCNQAESGSHAAVAAYHVHAYRRAYDAAVSGIRENDQCTDSTWRVPLAGFLLGEKALAEHKLRQGYSRIDLDRAMTLLADCQTDPDLHASENAAACEDFEDNLAKEKTAWDLTEMVTGTAAP